MALFFFVRLHSDFPFLSHFLLFGIASAPQMGYQVPVLTYLSIFFFFFLMRAILKIFIEFVTMLLLLFMFCVLASRMWILSSPARDKTHTPCIRRWSLNHWTARESWQSFNILYFLWSFFGNFTPKIFSPQKIQNITIVNNCIWSLSASYVEYLTQKLILQFI